MASFNQVTLLGNATRDPELRYMPNNQPVVTIGMATNRRFKDAQGQDREEVCFVDCTAFGKSAEILNQYVRKGRPLFIVGRLKYETWDDKQGQKRSRHTVVIEQFQLLGDRRDTPDADNQAPATSQRPGKFPNLPKRDHEAKPSEPPFDSSGIGSEDVPF
jgi:single-strand DNA-binding protein